MRMDILLFTIRILIEPYSVYGRLKKRLSFNLSGRSITVDKYQGLFVALNIHLAFKRRAIRLLVALSAAPTYCEHRLIWSILLSTQQHLRRLPPETSPTLKRVKAGHSVAIEVISL
ncbi:MAG: hypothetical protein V7785_24885 [Bermanella sp.]